MRWGEQPEVLYRGVGDHLLIEEMEKPFLPLFLALLH